MIKVKLYQTDNQVGINSMMQEIAKEFETPIFNTLPSAPKLIDKFWVAFSNNEVIGTIGILRIKDKGAVLKSMFVKKSYRGKTIGVSKLLLETVLKWSHTENIKSIYLGTMRQFKAAHKFYEKNGFQKVARNKLPRNFVDNPIDDVFYKIRLGNWKN